MQRGDLGAPRGSADEYDETVMLARGQDESVAIDTDGAEASPSMQSQASYPPAPPTEVSDAGLPDEPSLAPRLSKPWWLRDGVRPYLLIADTLAFVVASAVSVPGHPLHILVLGVNLLLFGLFGLYRSRLTLSVIDDFPYILFAVVVGATLKMALFGVAGVDPPVMQVRHASALLVAAVLLRALAYAVVRGMRASRRIQHRTAVVGAGPVGTRLAQSLLEHPQYGLDPVGFVDSDPTATQKTDLKVPLLGGYQQLGSIIREHGVTNVLVAFGAIDDAELVDVLETCDRLDCKVFLIPRLLEIHNKSRDTDEVWGIPLTHVRRPAFQSWTWRLKRLLDIAFATTALLALLPVLAVCAAAVRLEGGSGVLFRQERVGRDGVPFELLKFRSMKPTDTTESSTTWNIKNDHRIGRVGNFLRRSSLDELPQLWNILRGDMTVVGPRPERPHFVEEFSGHVRRYSSRHRVPAGLTGWAQIHGLRGDTSIADRARFDNYYIENWSLWLDLRIIVRTVDQVLGRRGG